ncbi:unnamed protein product [Prorocentrum cordatum]|uniref:Uncharacterized protein n=1 Tax=Prorocentrum cordatum TaxID=2364126 RepID=A0ABN9PFV6_9DINO|nr:unnamed protein product [Polarella glacialis]
MVVAGRLQWVRRHILQGVCTHITVGSASVQGRSKVKIILDPAGPAISDNNRDVLPGILICVEGLLRTHVAMMTTMTGLVAMTLVAEVGMAIAVAQSMAYLTPGMVLEVATHGVEVVLVHGNSMALRNDLVDVQMVATPSLAYLTFLTSLRLLGTEMRLSSRCRLAVTRASFYRSLTSIMERPFLKLVFIVLAALLLMEAWILNYLETRMVFERVLVLNCVAALMPQSVLMVPAVVKSQFAELQHTIEQTMTELTALFGRSRSVVDSGPHPRPRPTSLDLPDFRDDDDGHLWLKHTRIPIERFRKCRSPLRRRRVDFEVYSPREADLDEWAEYPHWLWPSVADDNPTNSYWSVASQRARAVACRPEFWFIGPLGFVYVGNSLSVGLLLCFVGDTLRFSQVLAVLQLRGGIGPP